MEKEAVDVEKLKELLESGVQLGKALEEIGEERAAYVITMLGELSIKDNTRSCSIANQYCGCSPC